MLAKRRKENGLLLDQEQKHHCIYINKILILKIIKVLEEAIEEIKEFSDISRDGLFLQKSTMKDIIG